MSSQLSMGIMLTIISISLAIAGALYFIEMRQQQAILTDKANEYVDYLVGALEQPLWNYDDSVVKGIDRAVSQSELVVYILVKDASGKAVDTIDKRTPSDVITREGKIYHGNSPIGDITISLTKEHLKDIGRHIFLIYAITLAVACLSLVVLVGGFVRLLLKKPLDALNQIIKPYTSGIYDQPTPVLPYKEFQAFGITLAQMGETIRRQMNEIGRHRSELEDTVRRRTEELVLARDAAEAANRAKSAFLANMSHDLRTPLNAILGFSSLMRREAEIPASQREKLDIINRSGEHLLNLVNDVLEMAKIEAGRLQLQMAAFDLGAVVRDVLDMMSARADEKGLKLSLDQASDLPRYINGDETKLRQVLVNLVGNAVKFTERGGVAVRLGARRNEKVHMLLEVEDSGPGVGREDQQRLFQPFVQLAETDMQKGTGLGLAITRQVVELMGGSIEIESEPGKGAIFRVDIPMDIAEKADVGSWPVATKEENVCGLEPGQQEFRILAAEDERDNQILMMKLLSDIGLKARLAKNGEECVRIFEEWRPHLILMDQRMPVMDGVEATRRIRQSPGGQDVKIIAVTASVFREQLQGLLDTGMDGCIRKPFRIEEIYGCLARFLGVRYVYRSSPGPAEPAMPVTMTPERLSALAAPLRARLKAALVSLNKTRIAAAVAEVGQGDADLARALTRLTDDFDYPAILKALGEGSLQGQRNGCGPENL